MTEFRDTLDILSRLRKVKYGDVVLSSDHNDLVDSVNALFDLILPSRINPYDFVYEPHYLFNFLEPEFVGQNVEDKLVIRTTVTKPSLVVVSRNGDGFGIGVNSEIGLGEPTSLLTRVAVCLKYIKREKNPVVKEDMYFAYAFGLGLGISNNNKPIKTLIGYTYNEEKDVIWVYYKSEGKVKEITKIPDDWHVVVLDYFSEKVYIYDRNGNVLGEAIAESSNFGHFSIVIVGGILKEDKIYPNEVNIDWVIF